MQPADGGGSISGLPRVARLYHEGNEEAGAAGDRRLPALFEWLQGKVRPAGDNACDQSSSAGDHRWRLIDGYQVGRPRGGHAYLEALRDSECAKGQDQPRGDPSRHGWGLKGLKQQAVNFRGVQE